MSKYTVNAQRGKSGRWVLQCLEVPSALSEAPNLRAAPDLIREAIAFVDEVPLEEVEVTVVPDLPEQYAIEVQRARTAYAEASEAQAEATEMFRRVARELVDIANLSGRDTAVVLGVSPQRVSQLLRT